MDLAFLIELAFGRKIEAIPKKIFMWFQRFVGLGKTMSIQLKNGQTIEIKNVSVILHRDSMRCILEAIKRGLVPKNLLPEDEINRKCEKFLKNATDVSRAKYATNTFRAIAKGFMKDLLLDDSDISIDDFDETVFFIYSTQKQDGIPYLEKQLKEVFLKCPPIEDEFLIGWADRVFLSNKRMIITSEGTKPMIEHEIGLDDIVHYTA